MSGSIISAPRPERGAELELTVDALAYGGNGVARSEGYVVFVPHTVPGDRVRVQLTKRRKGYAESRLLELLEPSPDRIEPRAPHPGAPWQVLPYERQLREKHSQIREALKRIGGFEDAPVAEMIPAEETWRYRYKVE